MSEALDLGAIEKAREVMKPLRQSDKAARRLLVPNIQSCRFDRRDDTFHVVFEDIKSSDVPVKSLHDIASRPVVDCKVDEYGRGVVVTLIDGDVTSFSAEFARVFGDPAYKQWVQSTAADGFSLAARASERVRALRAEKGWSIAELARRAQMAAPNVHRVESAKHVPSMQTLVRLSRAFRVPVAHFVEATERKARATSRRRR